MAIDFTPERWKKVTEDSEKWWKGELGRPLVQVRLNGRNAGRLKPNIPYYLYTSFYEDSVSAEQIVDCWDYQLCQTEFMGDAFPCVLPNFGPGVVAAFLGARVVSEQNTVWFHPEKQQQIDELEFHYRADNPWLLRIKDIINSAVRRWNGAVQIAMTDLGGTLDAMSSFRPSENLLFDLYDHPEAVKKVLWNVSDLWFRYFKEFTETAGSGNPGFSHWALVFSKDPHYILQSDFSYMIGPEKFEEFVLPELKSTSQKLRKTFYHLDGVGQLVNLDSLLKVDTIQGIQWVPGAGQPDITHWPEVLKKIADAGKKTQISSAQTDKPLEVLDAIERQTGRIDNVVYTIEDDLSRKSEYKDLLKRCNIA